MAKTLWYTLASGDNPVIHLQAQLLCVSLLANRSPDSRIAVCTDRPGLYDWLAPAVDVRAVAKAQLDAWMGGSRYFFRAKACLMVQTADDAAAAGESAAWLDSDMVAVRPLAPLEQAMAGGAVLMQEDHGLYASRRTRSERAYWNCLKDREFAGYGITETSHQWNSGVVGVGPADTGLLREAVAVLDAIGQAGITQRTREQVAISMVLEATGRLRETPCEFVHYWANKEGWRQFLEHSALEFLSRRGDAVAAEVWYRGLVPQDFPARRATRRSRAERWKRKIRKKLGLLAPCERRE